MKKANKNLLKVTLIVLAVLAAVTAVLVFLKSRMEPPQRLTYTNQYTEDIRNEAEQIANADEQALEQSFKLVINRIELMKKENLITDEERNSSIAEFMNAYVPAFCNWCEQRFGQSVWPNATLQFMRGRINEVNRYDAAADYSIVSEENKILLDEVDKVLKDYNEAWRLQSVAIHKSSDSRTNLNKARRFKNDSHLSKCSALVNMLDNLPSRYQQSHFNYVNSLVKGLSMSNFPSANQIDEWAEKYKAAKSAISDYNSVASSLYHTSTSDFNLNSYYYEAKSGFRNKISKWDPVSIRRPYEKTFGPLN